MKRRNIHYAWLILVSCCVMQGVGIGIISNCAGIYYTPICEELGFSMGQLTFYKTLSGIFSILSLSMAPLLFKKLDVRVFAFGLIAVAGGVNFAMAFGTKLWHWYLIGILQGCTLTCFSHFLPVTLINNWFSERVGFAMGISCAASGGVGMVMSHLLGGIVQNYGWRASAMANGIVCVALTAPFALFVIRKSPKEMGMEAFGAERLEVHAKEKAGPDADCRAAGATGKAPEARGGNGGGDIAPNRLPVSCFLMVVVFSVCAKATVGFAQYLTGYGDSVAALAGTGSMLLTLYLFGNMCFKFFFGYTNDRLGVFKSTCLELAVLLTGCFLLLSHQGGGMAWGAVLFGTCAMLSNVQSPLLVRTLWDKEHFAKAYARMAMIADASYYISITLFGFVYDFTGKYEPVLMICMAGICLEAVLICGLFGPGRRKEALRVRRSGSVGE